MTRFSLSLVVWLSVLCAAFGQGTLHPDVAADLEITTGDVAIVSVTPGTPTIVDVTASGQTFQLVMSLHSVRGANFQILVQDATGQLVPHPAPPVRTYRGHIAGIANTVVAGSILDDGVHASIRLPNGDVYWLQPLSRLQPSAAPNEHALYQETSLIPHAGYQCQALTLSRTDDTAGPVPEGGGGNDVAELACDSDYEYFLDWGSVTGVTNRIESVINTMNTQYETEVGITHVIPTIIVRTSDAQPYTHRKAERLLNQVRSEWLNNQTSISRDVVQLFTGKSIIGGTIGIAWVGVICNTNYHYGLVESDFSSNFAYVTDLSAHELGHNWSAPHCSCTSHTMNPYITGANQFHPTLTIPTIISHRNSRTCLNSTTVNPPGSVSSPSPADGATNVATSASLTWNAATGATSYEVFMGTSSGNLTSQGTTSGTSWSPTLSAGTTYFWRVDASNTAGTTAGPEWSFTTSSGGTGNLFSDDFESGLGAWTTSGPVSTTGSAAFTGGAGAQLRSTASMQTTVAVGGANVTLTYARRTQNLDAGEFLTVEWRANGAGSWTVLEQTSASSWGTSNHAIGTGGAATIEIRFSSNANKNNERCHIDDVVVN